ncbi:MAG TPA: transposase [Algoriphagus sp.]|jgi:transposase-like protein|nr:MULTISPECIES: transposase [unclassified Algoriphagus]MAL14700.1 transposase [Algoriphagus sp.]MAN86654.1 transposase [Algoriphagus sp.]HAH36486.1 transposase [Algoriphagus sp.]HAS61071.1 transposase [Algoriphagus sp.]HAZ24012.1 transposase [Algoriphagus sp.]|tara:strand:- start:150 stop:536 length:387 start_codon:yes stop_codon:yes gene_type:complete
MTKRFQLKAQRIFSEDLRRQIVGQIERKELTVLQAVREYGIGGKQTVYTWLYKYSTTLKKGTRMVMEKDSQDNRVQVLKSRIKELEAALGRKSLEADLYRIIVEQASDEFRVDLKKSFGDPASKSQKK